jgi:hypothetical protein
MTETTPSPLGNVITQPAAGDRTSSSAGRAQFRRGRSRLPWQSCRSCCAAPEEIALACWGAAAAWR